MSPYKRATGEAMRIGRIIIRVGGERRSRPVSRPSHREEQEEKEESVKDWEEPGRRRDRKVRRQWAERGEVGVHILQGS